MNKFNYHLSKFYENFNVFVGYDKFLAVLILLVPTALVSGPFLPDLLIVIISIIFLFKIFFLKFKEYFLSKYFYFFLIFWLYLCGRSIFTDHLYFSIKSSFPYIRFFLFSLTIFYLHKNYKNNFIYLLLFSIFLPVLFVFIDTIIQYILGEDIFGYPKLQHRLSGPFGSELIVGSYLARVTPMAIICFYIINKEITAKIYYLSILLGVVVFLSGERTSFFLYVFFLFFFSLFAKIQSKSKSISVAFLIFVILITSILFLDKNVRERMILGPICQMKIEFLMNEDCIQNISKEAQIKNGKKKEKFFIFSSSHEAHFLTALKMFQNNQLFGIGPKLFRKYCDDPNYYVYEGCTTHPHNLLMQILSETGLVGLVFFIIVISYIYIKLFRFGKKIFNKTSNNSINNQFNLLLVMSQSFMFLLPAGQFFNNWNAIVIYLPLGIYLKYALQKN